MMKKEILSNQKQSPVKKALNALNLIDHSIRKSLKKFSASK